jgi:hypothetical protein
VHRADNVTTLMCQLSRNLGASTSWNPKGLSRPVMGLLYLYLTYSEAMVENIFLLGTVLPSRVHVLDMQCIAYT